MVYIAALIVGKAVGITQISLNICRYKYGASSFQLIENALIKITTFIKDNNQRVIIDLGTQTNSLSSQHWIDILNDLFEEITELSGSKNINTCNSYASGSTYVMSVSTYLVVVENVSIFMNQEIIYIPLI